MTIEELQTQLLAEQEKTAKLSEEVETLKSNNQKLSEDNTRLMEHNNKLFMRVSSQPDDEVEKDTEETQIERIKKIMEERRF